MPGSLRAQVVPDDRDKIIAIIRGVAVGLRMLSLSDTSEAKVDMARSELGDDALSPALWQIVERIQCDECSGTPFPKFKDGDPGYLFTVVAAVQTVLINGGLGG